MDLIETDLFASALWVIATLLLVGYGPTVSALVITASLGGKGEVKGLLQRFILWRVAPKIYMNALGLPIVAFGIVMWLSMLLAIIGVLAIWCKLTFYLASEE